MTTRTICGPDCRCHKHTATPRTDEQIWTTEFDHKPCDVVDMPFARELERELAASKAEIKELKESAERIGTNRYEQLKKAEAEVAFWKSKAYEAEQSEGQLEAEVERLKNGFQGSCYCCEPVGILNQKLEAEIKKLKTEYWFMEEALNKEIAALKSEIK